MARTRFRARLNDDDEQRGRQHGHGHRQCVDLLDQGQQACQRIWRPSRFERGGARRRGWQRQRRSRASRETAPAKSRHPSRKTASRSARRTRRQQPGCGSGRTGARARFRDRTRSQSTWFYFPGLVMRVRWRSRRVDAGAGSGRRRVSERRCTGRGAGNVSSHQPSLSSRRGSRDRMKLDGDDFPHEPIMGSRLAGLMGRIAQDLRIVVQVLRRRGPRGGCSADR